MATRAELKRMFEGLVQKERLGHGYFFFGESATAMADFGRSLATFLEEGSWEARGPLLDLEFRDSNVLSGIDAARTIGQFLVGKPFRSSRRTMILSDVHKLTVHAQNAILKVSEDPPPHALILITALHPESVIPALASRFQKFFVSAPRSFQPEPSAEATAREVLSVRGRARAELLKSALEGADAAPLVHALIYILAKDLGANALMIRSLLARWTAMNQWNTNRRLQIEAALEAN